MRLARMNGRLSVQLALPQSLSQGRILSFELWVVEECYAVRANDRHYSELETPDRCDAIGRDVRRRHSANTTHSCRLLWCERYGSH